MRTLIAMSGGVDSSVAAYLMTEQGYECIGCTMKLYDNEDVGIKREHTCCSLDDVEDARAVAYRLGMKYYVFNFAEDFREKIIDKFVQSYEMGITPNPCIDCNRYMKFDRLYERAKVLGCEYIVTGHYVRIRERDGRYELLKAVDASKDQSYVLYAMTQEQLAHTRFPLGELRKSEVRELAGRAGFINADKPDSQDICFVPDGDYAAAIERFTGKKSEPGEFVSPTGEVLGQHRGIVHYTVGQRKGLGISSERPLYVCGICPECNQVILGSDEDVRGITARVAEMNWISGVAPTEDFRCAVKIRYRHAEQPATIRIEDAGTITVSFDEPQRAITPGQAAVLYDGDVVLGGGIIQR